MMVKMLVLPTIKSLIVVLLKFQRGQALKTERKTVYLNCYYNIVQ